MQHIPSWEAKLFSANQAIPHIIWNAKVQYRIHKCPPSVPILSQIDALHSTTSLFLRSHLNIIFPSTCGSSRWPLSLSPPKPYIHLSSLPHVLHAPHISFFSIWSSDHPSQIYRSLSSSLCIFLHYHVISPLLGPNKFSPKYSNCSTFSNKLLPNFVLWLCPAFSSRDMTMCLVLSAFTTNLITYHKTKTDLYTTHLCISEGERVYWWAGCETANRLFCWCCLLVIGMWNSQQTVLLVLCTGEQDVKQPTGCFVGAVYWLTGCETANRLFCWCCLLVSMMWSSPQTVLLVPFTD
jgi:hypothetical protein